MSLKTEVRIKFDEYKDNINFYKDKTSFIFHKTINNLECSYGFINCNEDVNMGVLVPNMSDLFGLIPNKRYIRIIDKEGFTIKLKYKENISNKKKDILIINPDNKILIGKLSN
jgi:hypothetical protein